MNADLGKQFLFGFWFDEDGFGDYFGSILAFSFGIFDEETRGKSTCVMEDIPLPSGLFF